MAFQARRGTNVSDWLCFSSARGGERAAGFTRADAKRIAAAGFDHIRLPLSEQHMWLPDGSKDDEAFELLDTGLDLCESAGLKAIVNLHVLRVDSKPEKAESILWTDPDEQEHFRALWRCLASHLRPRPSEQLAYEIFNEFLAPSADQCNCLALSVFDEVRETEPDREILLGSNTYNSPNTFDELEVPDDDHCTLTFHNYQPMPVTHYRASWWQPGGRYDGPISYPGVTVRPEDLSAYDAEVREALAMYTKPYGPEDMPREIVKPLAVRKRTGRPLYCGEFGCIEHCPDELRRRWLRDFVALLDRGRIGWSNWDYRGLFGAFTPDGAPTVVAEALVGMPSGERPPWASP